MTRWGSATPTTHGSVRVDDDPIGVIDLRHGVDVPPRRKVRANEIRARDGRVGGTSRTASSRSRTWAAESVSRPPSGALPTARAQGATTTASSAEQRSTAEAASGRRGALMRAIPSTVAAMRERDDRSDAVVPRIRHRAEVRQPVREQLRQRDGRQAGREHEEEEERQTEPDEVGEVVGLGQRREDHAGVREEHLARHRQARPPTWS